MTTPILLMDTHVWLWFALGDTSHLGVSARKKIEATVLATADERLLEYGKAGFMRILDVW